MCSISGVSFAPGSTINRHRLAAALLAAGQVRGKDASGYAWSGPSGDGLYKRAIPGSRLHVGRIPSDASVIIAHTRAATHGSPTYNENNHPVESPEGDIRLVHNGVIWNHEEVREALGKKIELPEVDSSVIPAVIETFGIDNTDLIEGDAACAWIDRETDDALHLARFHHSPVAYAKLYDGSFVFASTPAILAKALESCGLAWIGNYPNPFQEMGEGEYFQVIDGEIVSETEVEWGESYSRYSSYGWRDVTSGKTTTQSGAQAMALADSAKKQDENTKAIAAAVLTGKGSEDVIEAELIDPADEADPDYYSDDEDASGGDSGWLQPFKQSFYSVGHDGDYATYTTLTGLLGALSWHSKLTGGENLLVGPEEKEIRWVNHFADIGHLSTDPEDDGDEMSWVKTEGALGIYRQQLPSWVPEGITKLRNLVGA
jgi:hypothetical protein